VKALYETKGKANERTRTSTSPAAGHGTPKGSTMTGDLLARLAKRVLIAEHVEQPDELMKLALAELRRLKAIEAAYLMLCPHHAKVEHELVELREEAAKLRKGTCGKGETA
jgi:hypothetical protein